jgi:hypothetical protein
VLAAAMAARLIAGTDSVNAATSTTTDFFCISFFLILVPLFYEQNVE